MEHGARRAAGRELRLGRETARAEPPLKRALVLRELWVAPGRADRCRPCSSVRRHWSP
jgi:hypothetical protein